MSSPAQHGRLWADDRRRQILGVAARLLAEKGVDGLRIPDVASAAGVTRPVIYRHFPNRQAILVALLESFGEKLSSRLEELVSRGLVDIPRLMRAIFETLCDTLESDGIGVWRLLNSAGPDPDIENVAQGIRERLIRHWHPRVAEVTGASEKDAVALTAMLAGAIPALVTLWQSGALTRGEAVAHLMRTTSALIDAYSPGSPS